MPCVLLWVLTYEAKINGYKRSANEKENVKFVGNEDHKGTYYSGAMVDAQQGMLHVPLSTVESGYGEGSSNINEQEKKKTKMTKAQLNSLERCFQEEIKLDPDRKMKLSKELSLQPKQIAVWFQNRKARWKNKQLEHLYESLRQEFNVVSREKELLQEELIQLKSLMRENCSSKKQPSGIAYSEATSVQYQLN